MTTRHAFSQVDVFTDVALRGNPLAVVHGAGGLDAERMQAFARWTNLSETTFLLAPTDAGADYRVRIFTPASELPFAGHPTLGSCHAWLEHGGVPKTAGEVVQQCAAGLVRIRLRDDLAAFAAPPLRQSALPPAQLDQVIAALGVTPASVRASRSLDNGPLWVALLLDHADTVLALEPDHAALRILPKVGVIGPHEHGSPVDFEVRAFAASIGVPEDPVTGSLNASLAQWLIATGVAPTTYEVAQGTRLERSGRVRIAQDGGETWVGGRSITCIDGHVML